MEGQIMSKFRSRTLCWKEVESDQVAGYKIYWSKGQSVSYESDAIYVKDLTEIVIPDALEDFVPEPGDYMFGITAIDKWGNESDIKTLKEPIHFSAPFKPESFWVEPISATCAPDSLWMEINDMALAIDRIKEPVEKTEMVDEFFENDDLESQHIEPEPKNPNQQPPDFYDDMGLSKDS